MGFWVLGPSVTLQWTECIHFPSPEETEGGDTTCRCGNHVPVICMCACDCLLWEVTCVYVIDSCYWVQVCVVSCLCCKYGWIFQSSSVYVHIVQTAINQRGSIICIYYTSTRVCFMFVCRVCFCVWNKSVNQLKLYYNNYTGVCVCANSPLNWVCIQTVHVRLYICQCLVCLLTNMSDMCLFIPVSICLSIKLWYTIL